MFLLPVRIEHSSPSAVLSSIPLLCFLDVGKYSFPDSLVVLSSISWLSPSNRWFSLELSDGFLHIIGIDMELSMTRKPKDHWVYQAAHSFSEARIIDSQEGSWLGIWMGFFTVVHELSGIICKFYVHFYEAGLDNQ